MNNKIDKILYLLEDAVAHKTWLKAEEYVDSSKLKGRKVVDARILASVDGSSGNYEVEINLNKPDTSTCTCPAEMKFCKHIVALALTYKQAEKTFITKDTLLNTLKKMEKDELIEIFEGLLTERPQSFDLIRKKL